MTININSLSSYGNLNAYTKRISMQTKYQKKKAGGKLHTEEERTAGAGTKKAQSIAQKFMEEKRAADQAALERYQESQKNRDEKMEKILHKLENGADLTREELDYLKEKNPQLYQKLQEQKIEQKALQEELEHARTKEDAEKIVFNHVTAKLATLNSVKNNPHIPDAKKMEIYSELQQSVNAIRKTYQKFQQSGKFHALPTDAEKRQVEKEENEAIEAQLTGKSKEDEALPKPAPEIEESETLPKKLSGEIKDEHSTGQKRDGDTAKSSNEQREKVENSDLFKKVKRAEERAKRKEHPYEALLQSSYARPSHPEGQTFSKNV